MRPMRRVLVELAVIVVAALVLAPRPARAHLGAIVARATLISPPPLVQTGDDGGLRFAYLPEEADKSYRLAWQDGDIDPTGRFTFYYMPQQLNAAADATFVDGRDATYMPTGTPGFGTIVRTVDGREARDVFVTCACAAQDAGQDPHDLGAATGCTDGGPRWCDNSLDWDTSQIPDGVYWIAAVNDDPPYHTYNTSDTPVRITHAGGHKAPVVIVARPDGIGPGADVSYPISLVVAGEGALSLGLAWGISSVNSWQKPVHPIADKIAVTPGGVTYTWDTRALDSDVYFVAATVTDDSKAATVSHSRYALSVYHHPDAGITPLDAGRADLGAAIKPGACACALGGRGGTGGGSALLIGALAFARLTRRARRGSRSACTG